MDGLTTGQGRVIDFSSWNCALGLSTIAMLHIDDSWQRVAALGIIRCIRGSSVPPAGDQEHLYPPTNVPSLITKFPDIAK